MVERTSALKKEKNQDRITIFCPGFVVPNTGRLAMGTYGHS